MPKKYAERKAPQRAKYGDEKRTPQMVGATMPAHRSSAEINLGFKIASYHSSPTAIERSRHLISSYRWAVGKKQDAPLTAGDVHRASLRVGAAQRDTSADYPKLKAQRAAENDALAAAIEKVRPKLADLVTVDDVLAAVPPEAVETMMLSRRGYAASVAMARLGIEKVHPERRGRHRIFAVRDLRRYRARCVRSIWLRCTRRCTADRRRRRASRARWLWRPALMSRARDGLRTVWGP